MVERQNLLQQRTYNKKERPNETDDVASETLGTSTCIGLLEAANRLHQKEKEIKNKTVAERRQGELL